MMTFLDIFQVLELIQNPNRFVVSDSGTLNVTFEHVISCFRVKSFPILTYFGPKKFCEILNLGQSQPKCMGSVTIQLIFLNFELKQGSFLEVNR